MKLKRRRTVEVPPKIKSIINNVTSTPLENIEEPLRSFSWEFDKGDFHHWVDLFNHFDTFFEKYIKPRKDLQLDDGFFNSDHPLLRNAVLQILRVIRIILEHCTNKHFYSSYEQHLASLLASTDADVVEACLQTLAAFLKKSIGKFVIRDASLNSRLFSLSQGWGGKEEGLGLVSSALQDVPDPLAFKLGSTLHFEFYALEDSSSDPTSTNQASHGLKVIHLPGLGSRTESDLELLDKLVCEYKVPPKLRFSLLTRLRFARAFASPASRQQYTCIRLYAFIVLVQACRDTDDLASFFNAEPEFINELVALLGYEDAISEKVRNLSLLSLVALCQDRSRQSAVLTAVTSGGNHGILSSLMQKAIDSVVNNSSKWSVVFAEALLSLVTVLVSSSSGCSALREAGFIPTLLPLLKDRDPQHLHLVSTAVHVLEAFMDYSNPAAALFRDLGGLDDTISRLMTEVSHVELQKNASDDPESSGSQVFVNNTLELDNMQLLYPEALISHHRRLLMKALLRAISLGTYAPGTTSRVCGSEESVLPHCLCIIFRRAKDFGGGVFSLAATVMSDLIHKDPTCFAVLEAAGLPSAFLDSIMESVLCSSEAISCIPQCLDALCLNNNGLQAVKERNALRCFVKVFTSKVYLRVLTADAPGTLSSGLDELLRHAASLRGVGVDMLIEILNTIAKIGSGVESSASTELLSPPPVPMETESSGGKDVAVLDETGAIPENIEPFSELCDTGMMNGDSFLPDCISNTARLLETILQNSDTCRIFIEKKGIESVMQLLTLPHMPLSVSLGQSLATSFKNFSPQHSNSLARVVCSFMREHLKSTDENLSSIGGSQLGQVEISNRVRVLRLLSSLESVLSLCNSLLKGSTAIVSELGSADSDVLKDLGKVYKEIIWQVSLSISLEVEEKKNVEVEPEGSDNRGQSNVAGRDSDDDSNASSIRYMNPLSIRNNSQPRWGNERDFVSVVRSGEGFTRRSRHGLARLRGARAGRFFEAFQIDSDAVASTSDKTSHEAKKRTPEMLVVDNLNKLASTVRSFFTALVKSLAVPSRRRNEAGSLASATKNIGTALAKIFSDALGFAGYSSSAGADVSLSVKCRYLGKVVEDMAAVTYDIRRRTCYAIMINNFYVHGTFKELLTTFEATSQLLWTLPFAASSSVTDCETGGEGSKLSHSSWILDTLQSYCRELEYFANSGILLSPTSTSQTQLLVQPVAVGLSIGLFPIPRDPEGFVRMLQTQILDVILPIWNNPLFPNCNPDFVKSIISLMNHVYSGVSDVRRQGNGIPVNGNQRFVPPPDETTIATIVEMGFSRARAEEALRRVEANSVEMAMEWLFSHAEDPVQEDDELARALALSLGNSSEAHKADGGDKSADVLSEEGLVKEPSVDDVLAAAMKFFHGSDSLAFPLTDLLVTLCNRNKGVDRAKVVSYLVQQLKICPLEHAKDTTELGVISHTLALILSEDESTRVVAAQSGVVSISIDILVDFMVRTESSSELLVPKCISALLLILDNLVQSSPKVSGSAEIGSLTNQISTGDAEEKPTSDAMEKDDEDDSTFENILGKPTGYLTMEESLRVLEISCDFVKRHVPPIVMQAVLQLCARLTKSHVLAVRFLEIGGLGALFGIPRSCFFPGYDSLASAIVRHLIEDPQTLQTAMETEIRQTLSGSRHGGRVWVKTFLTTMAPVISRDPVVFMRAANAVCQIESSGGRSIVVLAKDKDKDKSKASGVETGGASNESLRISEGKVQDGSNKSVKGHKKLSTNLTQVIDHLLEIVSVYPSYICEDDSPGKSNAMDVDESTAKLKGKAKVGEAPEKTESDALSEKSALLAKVSFVLKLLSDILMMYVHAAGVILRRDVEIFQPRGPGYSECSGKGGIIRHVLHRVLPLLVDKTAGSDEWRNKLSEKASWFLVVLAGRSSEGRRRVVNELVKAFSMLMKAESNSSKTSLVPDKKVFAFVDLLHSILSKISSSANLPGSGCSPDVAKTMIDGGIISCLSGILQVIDLDHPNAPKVVNLILKSLESLTRAANYNERVLTTDALNKDKINGPTETTDPQLVGAPASQESEDRSHQQLSSGDAALEVQSSDINQNDGDHNIRQNESSEQEMRIEEAPSNDMPIDLGVDYMREDMEEGGSLSHTEQFEMSFHVQDRVDDDMNDEEDDMGDDGEDDEDEDDGEDEDEDIAEDGTGLMSLADTDVDDHEDTGLAGEEYNDMVDDEDEDFHDNRVIEVRWREALDGLDHLQVLGHSRAGGGLINISSEPFEGVNIDDSFGIRRPFGFDRRRQTNRASNERSVAEGSSSFQHPLLSRPSSTGEFVSILSTVGNSSRGFEGLSVGNIDLANFMFDRPVLRYGNNAPTSLFGDRLGTSALSIGLESVRVSGRRGPGDGRWTDDGQPQAGGQANVVAQAVEQHFISQLNSNGSAENAAEELPQNPGSVEGHEGDPNTTDDQMASGGVNTVPLQNDNRVDTNNDESNPDGNSNNNLDTRPSEGEAPPEVNNVAENTAVLDVGPTEVDRMEIGEESASGVEPLETPSDLLGLGDHNGSSVRESTDVDMNVPVNVEEPPLSHGESSPVAASQIESNQNNNAPNENAIDPTFLEALPEDLRAEVIASQQAQSAPAPTPSYMPPVVDDIDPEFLAALPPDIQAEVLAQQRIQRIAQQSEGQPVDMDNASIIATLPADIREEVLLTSSEAVLSALPSSLLAEAQMLRDRAMSHYQARSLFGGGQRLGSRANRLGFDRHTVMDRGIGVSLGRTGSASDSLKLKEIEGKPLVDADGLKALIRLLRLAQPLGKGLLQRLLLNLCSHGDTRMTLVRLLMDVIKPENLGSSGGLTPMNSLRLYGCQSDVVYSRSQVCDGVPPLVLRRALEILTYLATNHASVSDLLFHFEDPNSRECVAGDHSGVKDDKGKGKGKVIEDGLQLSHNGSSAEGNVPLMLLLKLLSQPLFLQSISHLEQVMSLIQVIVYAAASNAEYQSNAEKTAATAAPENPPENETMSGDVQKDSHALGAESQVPGEQSSASTSQSDCHKGIKVSKIFLRIPQPDLHYLCSLLGRGGLSDKVYTLAGEVLTKLATIAAPHRKYFISELSELAQGLSTSACSELVMLRNTNMLGLNAGSLAGSAVLRVLQILSSLTSAGSEDSGDKVDEDHEECGAIMYKLNVALEPLWKELSECISATESELDSAAPNNNIGEQMQGPLSSPPFPPGTQRLLPFIEGFFVLCEKLQANNQMMQQDLIDATAREVKESFVGSSSSSLKCADSGIFLRFAEKHRRLLNAFVRQNPSLLEKSLSVMLKAPRLIDFDNKKAYFRSRIRQQLDQQLSGTLRISVRRAYILEDSYNQLRMRPSQDLRGRLNVHFQGEEGIDAGGLTREWYQILSRVIFDKGALLFTTVGNNATFQPNPNSVYQTEHLSYFRFVGRVVAKALYDGQLLDVYFTRSFYKHILGVKVTYHDIEAVDPDYYKNLKWMLENDVSDIPDLTFSMDADEEKHILYEKTEVTDYELKPGGRNIRVTEETKHEYVDLVADHILTNAIRPQINAFLEGFNELVPKELVSIFNDKELELLISGLPEIDLDDLKANTEYTGYTAASSVIQWFWEAVKGFSKEDRARLLQFVTGTSKVPLEGFKALQGISGPQRFQIHKAYGAPERLPSAHTCFNQLDLPEYSSKEQLQERLLLAIHEGNEGFGFG